jgi:subfamily B ATP-binding cassette protein MsbA
MQRTAYRAALGYVTQDAVVFSGSVLRNVTMRWDREPTPKEFERAREAARLANCLQVIENLEDGWETELGERGGRLSGGERQRVAIARELYQDPQLLILDEATSSLDSVSEQAVQRSLQLLHGKLTLLIVSHRLSTIRHADVVYVVEDGQVAESGTFDELAQRRDGRFRQLCEMQSLI